MPACCESLLPAALGNISKYMVMVVITGNTIACKLKVGVAGCEASWKQLCSVSCRIVTLKVSTCRWSIGCYWGGKVHVYTCTCSMQQSQQNLRGDPLELGMKNPSAPHPLDYEILICIHVCMHHNLQI